MSIYKCNFIKIWHLLLSHFYTTGICEIGFRRGISRNLRSGSVARKVLIGIFFCKCQACSHGGLRSQSLQGIIRVVQRISAHIGSRNRHGIERTVFIVVRIRIVLVQIAADSANVPTRNFSGGKHRLKDDAYQLYLALKLQNKSLK